MDTALSWRQRIVQFSRKLKLHIPPDALVLEVGSGGAPHFRSDVLCDKYVSRGGTGRIGKLRIDRHFVFGDAEALPFADQSFDYVIAFHILEHLDHPEHCLEELMRVARAGYVETPSEFAEKTHCWTTHKWFVRLEDSTLILTQKTRPVFDSSLHVTFHSLAAAKDRAYLKFIWKKRDLFYVNYEWEKQIDYEITRPFHESEPLGTFDEPIPNDFNQPACDEKSGFAQQTFELDEWIKAWVSKGLRRPYASRDVPIYDMLACPICKQKVTREEDRFICSHCSLFYPTQDGIPILLQENARLCLSGGVMQS